MVSDDRLDQRLRGAGGRARDGQPDAAETREAYERRRSSIERRRTPDHERRRRMGPALIGTGLVIAAVVGIVAFSARRGPDTPAPTIDTAHDPASTTAPDTTDAQSATSSAPVVPSPCDRTRSPDDTGDVVIVNCRRGEDGDDAALVAQVSADAPLADATRWFVEYAPLSTEPVELYFPATVDGIANTISFLRDFESGLHCVVLIEQVIRGEWKEACWLDTPVTQVVTNWSGAVVQFDLDNPRAAIAHPLDGIPLTSAGCTSTDLAALLTAADQPGTVIDGLGCVGDTAVVHEPWTRTQPGLPEGALRTFTRASGEWTEQPDNDTSIEYAFTIPEYPVWASRTTNEPTPVAYDIEALNNRPVFERSDPTRIATLAAQLISDDTGIATNQWISDADGTFIEIPIIDPDDHTSIIAWHFLHLTGAPDTGYQILAWYQANT